MRASVAARALPIDHRRRHGDEEVGDAVAGAGYRDRWAAHHGRCRRPGGWRRSRRRPRGRRRGRRSSSEGAGRADAAGARPASHTGHDSNTKGSNTHDESRERERARRSPRVVDVAGWLAVRSAHDRNRGGVHAPRSSRRVAGVRLGRGDRRPAARSARSRDAGDACGRDGGHHRGASSSPGRGGRARGASAPDVTRAGQPGAARRRRRHAPVGDVERDRRLIASALPRRQRVDARARATGADPRDACPRRGRDAPCRGRTPEPPSRAPAAAARAVG